MQFLNINNMICIVFILIAVISFLPKIPFDEFQPNFIPCSSSFRIFSGCESVIESVVRPGAHLLTSNGK